MQIPSMPYKEYISMFERYIMDRFGLLAKTEAQIALCEAEYQRYAEDSYLSHVLAYKQKTLRSFLECLQKAETPEMLRTRLEQELPRLKEALGEEAEHPSFDWYDEHYHYKALEGELEAYQCMLRLLQNTGQGTEG